MKHLKIKKPCSENWAEMTPTQKGAFCQKCATQVIDFSNQSSDEIRKTLLLNKGKEVCGRITEVQLNGLNNEFEAWRQSNAWSMQRVSFYAFLFVFGLSIVSCSRQEDEKQIVQLHETAQRIIDTEEITTLNQAVLGPDAQGIKGAFAPPPPPVEEIEVIHDYDLEHENITREKDSIILYPPIVKHHIIMGAMVSTRHYLDYMEDIVPEEKYDENGRLIPTEFNALAFPNPTSGRTTLKFEVPETTNASFELYSMTGERVRSMGSAEYEPGTYEIPFDLSQEKPGTYIIAILSNGFKKSVKVVKM